MAESEVARLRERIISEYQATKRVFDDFTISARHDFIQQREENIEHCYQELQQYLPPEEAILVVVQAEESVYGCGASSGSTS